ncbi:DNA-directed RNA polymerase subunit beta [Hydrogenibacillus schlegelii]|uniref:DNA-directed RNA polymerase subunit beta n=2 Tax=Hydrogenibacillus schlegelii TaxID=1484 RepID=A0A179INJ8_HYDSH|nr:MULTISPECIES: DNA-directed RNA polymerase subunit beta [Hydrogenibacillus]MBT9282207.1 DNA-directed RNA polymerase subunit beta [Hydrogenibacillus schlegelii]OAR04228.1 hypothetical protein SA87_07210 [Hydrogenibacillus schlegelii]QZA32935.1 DNA-directed RNA polymerase subunit beta [Hydrogenibacillus sp. N12]
MRDFDPRFPESGRTGDGSGAGRPPGGRLASGRNAANASGGAAAGGGGNRPPSRRRRRRADVGMFALTAALAFGLGLVLGYAVLGRRTAWWEAFHPATWWHLLAIILG